MAAGDELVWERPKKGETHHATISTTGGITIADGREFFSPSGAACAAADVPACDGWFAWIVTASGKRLHDVRAELIEALAETPLD